MIDYVHVHSRLLNQLDDFKQMENVNAFAAKKAGAVIKALIAGMKPARAGKLTRHGDARIKNCLKYDLGKGFRLVCVKDGRNFYVLFAGSHDRCDTWMDKHRNLKVPVLTPGMERLRVKPRSNSRPEFTPCSPPEQVEHFPEQQIPQKILRSLFQGLVNSP
jgi:hypothetical protein